MGRRYGVLWWCPYPQPQYTALTNPPIPCAGSAMHKIYSAPGAPLVRSTVDPSKLVPYTKSQGEKGA